MVSNEADTFLGTLISNSTCPSILINKSLSHQIVSLLTGALLVNVMAGYPPTDTLLLPLWIWIVPKVKSLMFINLPPKLLGIVNISSLVKFSIGPAVNL